MRVAIGCRWSDGEGGANSIADQRRRCEEFAAARGWEVVAVYEVVGESSGMDRSDIRAIADLVRRDAVDVILYLYSARYNREKDEAQAWERAVLWPANAKRAGQGREPIRVVFVETPNLDRRTPDGYIQYEVQATFDTAQKMRIKHNTQRGMDSRRAAGIWCAPPKAFTLLDPANPGVPLRGPDWEWLLWGYRQVDAGATVQSVAARYHELGLPTSNGGRWHHTTVTRLLRSTFFAGYQVVDGQRVALKHDCTVPLDLWERVTAAIAPRGRPHSAYIYLLGDLLYCPHWRVLKPAQYAGPLPLRGKTDHGTAPGYYPIPKVVRDRGHVWQVIDDGQMPDFRKADAATVEAQVMDAVLARIDRQGTPWLLGELRRESDVRKSDKQRELTAVRRRLRDLRTRLADTEELLNSALRMGLADAATLQNRRLGELGADLGTLAEDEAVLAGELLAWAADDTLQVQAQRISLLRHHWESGARAEVRKLLPLLVQRVDYGPAGPTIIYRRLPGLVDDLLARSG